MFEQELAEAQVAWKVIDPSLPEVSGLEAHDFGAYVQVQWRWPEGCRLVRVCFRLDQPPRGPLDATATCHDLTRAAYQQHGGFRVEEPTAGTYHFAIHTAEGERFSVGAAVTVTRRKRTAIYYDLKRNWWKGKHVSLMLWAEEAVGAMPEVVLVGRAGAIQPRTPESGEVLLRLPTMALATAPNAAGTLDLKNRPRPLYLRLFFAEPSAYEHYTLIDPQPSQLRIE